MENATKPKRARASKADKARDARLKLAYARLSDMGAVTGIRSRKLSVRIDPGIIDAAAKELGLTNPSDVINASLILAASPDRFKNWLRETEDQLPDDFELAL